MLSDLNGQLASGSEDESAQMSLSFFVCFDLFLQQTMDDWNPECQGLSGSLNKKEAKVNPGHESGESGE